MMVPPGASDDDDDDDDGPGRPWDNKDSGHGAGISLAALRDTRTRGRQCADSGCESLAEPALTQLPVDADANVLAPDDGAGVGFGKSLAPIKPWGGAGGDAQFFSSRVDGRAASSTARGGRHLVADDESVLSRETFLSDGECQARRVCLGRRLNANRGKIADGT